MPLVKNKKPPTTNRGPLMVAYIQKNRYGVFWFHLLGTGVKAHCIFFNIPLVVPATGRGCAFSGSNLK